MHLLRDSFVGVVACLSFACSDSPVEVTPDAGVDASSFEASVLDAPSDATSEASDAAVDTGADAGASTRIGVVIDASRYDAVSLLDGWNAWLPSGHAAQIVTDYSYPSLGSVNRMIQMGGSKTPSQRKGIAASGLTLVWSTALCPFGSTLSHTAAGDHDALYTAEAQNLAAYGFTHVIWRLGWENDGANFIWAANYGTNTPATFAAAYQRVVGLIRAVTPTAQFEYNSGMSVVKDGKGGWKPPFDPESAYPGDSYVDYIGTDKYGDKYQSGLAATDAQIWNDSLKLLTSMKAFADKHHKPFAVSEWGNLMHYADDYGSNDSAFYITSFLDWAKQNDVAYHTYFNANDLASDPCTITSASGGATSLTVSSTQYLLGKGSIRVGTDKSVHEIDYTSISGTTLLGIPSSGHGSIPSGGYKSGTQVTKAIRNRGEIAVGSSADQEYPPFQDDAHMASSAAAYRNWIVANVP